MDKVNWGLVVMWAGVAISTLTVKMDSNWPFIFGDAVFTVGFALDMRARRKARKAMATQEESQP